MKLLSDKKLINGMHLSFFNDSRQVAGDRWLVVLKIVSTMPLSEKMLSEIANGEDSEYLLGKFDGNLKFELERKKHFVDEKDVDGTLEDLMALTETNMADYFDRQDFGQRLFVKQVEKYKEQYLLEKHLGQKERISTDVDEPDDFSACFK